MKREVTLGRSRIDFLVNGKDYLEVKTPLMLIPTEHHKNYVERKTRFASFDRMIKHFGDTSKSISGNSRAIFLLCNMYDAKPFQVPRPEEVEPKIVRAARKAARRGLENWQINLKMEKDGVSLIDCFKLILF